MYHHDSSWAMYWFFWNCKNIAYNDLDFTTVWNRQVETIVEMQRKCNQSWLIIFRLLLKYLKNIILLRCDKAWFANDTRRRKENQKYFAYFRDIFHLYLLLHTSVCRYTHIFLWVWFKNSLGFNIYAYFLHIFRTFFWKSLKLWNRCYVSYIDFIVTSVNSEVHWAWSSETGVLWKNFFHLVLWRTK